MRFTPRSTSILRSTSALAHRSRSSCRRRCCRGGDAAAAMEETPFDPEPPTRVASIAGLPHPRAGPRRRRSLRSVSSPSPNLSLRELVPGEPELELLSASVLVCFA
jgi:hypothetical protein